MYKPVDANPNFPEIEEKILEFWEKNNIFEKSLAKTKDGQPYTFYDGPPFATGSPHYGHILASTIKDLIPRYQTMKGRFVRRRWGWDCHGLPIEEIVERELKISGKKEIEKIGIQKFNETCRKMVLMYVADWRKMVRRIARWIDFDNSYKTMDRDYMESVWWAFKEIYNKGLVYEGRKVLLYCPRCETPVSNFEVAMDNSYRTVTEEAVTVKFKVRRQENTYLLAWTTTPWTLPGNVALAVGEDIDYVKVKKNNEYFILAKDLLDKVLTGPVDVEGEFKGKDLVGFEYEPLFSVPDIQSDKSYKVYAADFVTTDEGTGIVHTAVVYGEEDYELGLRESLPIVPLLDDKGEFNDKAPELVRGDYFKEAESKIIKYLQKRGLLFKTESHTHSYPHCWRCDNELFYNAIPAWFINIQKIKDDLLKTNDKQINWYPSHLKHGRYQKSVEAAPDWNISRNRYWGNAIPVWKCDSCQSNTVIGSVKELSEKAISGFKEDLDLHRPYIDEVIVKCDECGGQARRIKEIFDSWVEAGSMPFAEYHYPFENREVFESRFPAQFVAEYIAQTRAWFYVMHVISQILFNRAPFENVVTTGTILAEDGSKMSKSKKNYPDPWKIINEYGVDTLRFYLMSSVVMQADNLNFSEKDLAVTHRKIVRILWNVYNYFVTYANESGWKVGEGERDNSNVLDQWISLRTRQLINSVTKYLDNYDTVKTTREIEKYIDDLSTWYLRRSRGRKDQAFFASLHNALKQVSLVCAPLMPFITEEINKNLTGEESVHLSNWPKAEDLSEKDKELLARMQEVREAAELGNAIRKQGGVKLRQPLAAVYVTLKDGEVEWSDEIKQVLLDELNVKEFKKTADLTWREYAQLKVGLDLNITPELSFEGDVRELERAVQSLRKEAGLTVGQPAVLYYQISDEQKKLIENIDLERLSISTLKEGKVDNLVNKSELDLREGKVWLGIEKLV